MEQPWSRLGPTLRLLRPLANTTLTAGASLRLRCEFSGDPEPDRFLWLRNEVPLRGRDDLPHGVMRRPQRVRGAVWRMRLKIPAVEVHDTGFYRCEASNGIDRAQSTAVVQVEPESRHSATSGGRNRNRGKSDGWFDLPVFPTVDPVFEFPAAVPAINSPSLSGSPQAHMAGRTNLNPPEDPRHQSGSCQPYRGRACLPFLANVSVFIADLELQETVEQRVTAALNVVTGSPDLSQRCGDFAVHSICLAALPPCAISAASPTSTGLVPPVGGSLRARARQLCRDECELLRDQVCRLEFTVARRHPLIGLAIHLPACQKLPPLGSPPAADCVRMGVMKPPAVDTDHTCSDGEGVQYRGTLSVTISGRPCLPWHLLPNYDSMVSQAPSLRGGHNFCRNWPQLAPRPRPWCYTELTGNGGAATQACAVPVCGGVAGGALLLPILLPCIVLACFISLAVAWCVRRRRRAKSISSPHHEKLAPSLTSATTEGATVELGSLLNRHQLHHVPAKSVRLIQEMGEGAFGKVYRGELLGATIDGTAVTVAVKTLKPDSDWRCEREFCREAELLSRLRHPNVVQLRAVVLHERPLCMLFEFMRHGDLHEYLVLRAARERVATHELLAFAVQVAAGMEYLSSNHYVHRDLAARNCLVSENRVVKISDFGLSRDVYSSDYYRMQSRALLPVRWMPAESIMYGKFSVESDIWSFGVLLWEIFSLGVQPYLGYSNSEVTELVCRRQLLPCPDPCPSPIYSLMLECWHETPSRRPSFSDLHTRLSAWHASAVDPSSSSCGSSTSARLTGSITGPSLMGSATGPSLTGRSRRDPVNDPLPECRHV